MFMFDVECLGIESDSVVLSAGMIHFDFPVEGATIPDPDLEYQRLVDGALFVKINAKVQLDKGRSLTPSTIDWWKAQSDVVRKKSYMPADDDLQPEIALKQITDYCAKFGSGIWSSKSTIFWQRGGLDQVAIDGFCRSFNQEPLIPYHNWMDVRTAIALTKETAHNGYCEVPGFDKSMVVKHDPVHDCAYDIMMLTRGK